MLFIAPPTNIYIYTPSNHHHITIASACCTSCCSRNAETEPFFRTSIETTSKKCSFPKTQKAGVCPAHTALLFEQTKWCGEGGELCKPAKKDSSSDGHVLQCEMTQSSCDWWVRKNVVDGHVLLISCVGSAGDRFHIDVW